MSPLAIRVRALQLDSTITKCTLRKMIKMVPNIKELIQVQFKFCFIIIKYKNDKL